MVNAPIDSLNAFRKLLPFDWGCAFFLADSSDNVTHLDDPGNLLRGTTAIGRPIDKVIDQLERSHHDVVELPIGTHRVIAAGIRPTVNSANESLNSRFLHHAEVLSSIGCFSWQMQTNVLKWSDGLFRICGEDPAEFQPTLESFMSRVVAEDRETVQRAIQ